MARRDMTKEEIAELWASKHQENATALPELRDRALASEYVPPRPNRHERRKARASK